MHLEILNVYYKIFPVTCKGIALPDPESSFYTKRGKIGVWGEGGKIVGDPSLCI